MISMVLVIVPTWSYLGHILRHRYFHDCSFHLFLPLPWSFGPKTRLNETNKVGEKCLSWFSCEYHDHADDDQDDYQDYHDDHCLEHVSDPSARGGRGCKVVETVKFRPEAGFQLVHLSPAHHCYDHDGGDGGPPVHQLLSYRW